MDNLGVLRDVVQQLLGGVEPKEFIRNILVSRYPVLPLEIVQQKSVLVVEKNGPKTYGNYLFIEKEL